MSNFIFQPLKSLGNSDANLYEVGYQHCDPAYDIDGYLPPHHVIQFVIRGHGCMRVGGRTYELGRGDGMFFAKHIPMHYSASESDPWYYVWLHFSGIKLEKYLHELHLSKRSPIFHVDDVDFCERQIMSFYNMATQCNDLMCVDAYGLSVCYSLFSEILRSNRGTALSAEEDAQPQAAYVERAIRYINDRLSQDVRVTEIASAVSLNPNYLCSLFRAETGLSIQEYIIRLRLQNARSLLVSTEISVTDVARMVGYKNPASFCKAFKKVYHTTPGAQR